MVRILETVDDPKSGDRVVVLESAWHGLSGASQEMPAQLPDACAACLEPATRRIRSRGEGNVYGLTHGTKRRVELSVPYCERCFKKDRARGRRMGLLVLLVCVPLAVFSIWLLQSLDGWWQAPPGLLAALAIGGVIAGVGIMANPLRDGSAVRIVVDGTEGPIRLHFRNPDYADRFAAANPPDMSGVPGEAE